jgi:hydrogenase maturation protein HypF
MVRRRRAEVNGRVQGVGFRPHVHRLATTLGLRGWVRNDAGGAVIDVEGDDASLDAFVDAFATTPLPPLARIDVIRWTDAVFAGAQEFTIVDATEHGSDRAADCGAGVRLDGLADAGPCDACTAEFDDPADRRFRYPFTCCTDCGPRLTIATGGPWARANTVMAGYELCVACKHEFSTPADRRFHAEAIACPDCGPILVHTGEVGATAGHQALDRLIDDVIAGGVAVVKGVGGHHLIGRADREDPVAAIRRIKGRDAKPMAVLVADVAAAHTLVELDAAATEALTDPGRNVVLAQRRDSGTVVDLVAGDQGDLGVVLPPSLLHLDLARAVGVPLVFTSANPSGAPTVVDDAAAATLAAHRDVTSLVTHDRSITARADDTVVRAMGGCCLTIRSGRGDAIAVRRSPHTAGRPVLAAGGHLKCTVSLAVGDHIHTSPHIGDLDHPAARDAWEHAVDSLIRSVGVEPELVVADRHPDYASAWWAQDLGIEVLTVQHHHAHAAAALVDADRRRPVVAVVLDGHGWGDDGTSWGGEILVVDADRSHRAAHLRPVALPGGVTAIREPWRMAVAWLCDDTPTACDVAATWDGDGTDVLEVCRWAVARGATTTSAGRLVDAIAAILGITGVNRYEGDAAMALESLATSDLACRLTPFDLDIADGEIDARPLVAQVVDCLRRGAPLAAIADAALAGIGRGFAKAAAGVASDEGIEHVVLSGGVLQNRVIDDVMCRELVAAGLTPHSHRSVPANDAGLSIGQAMIGAARG